MNECCKKNNCGEFAAKVCKPIKQLISEFNFLGIEDTAEVTDPYALVGSYINLEYGF